jgi:hypothetical protein
MSVEQAHRAGTSFNRRIVVRNVLIPLALLVLAALFAFNAVARPEGSAGPQLAHMVFFALKDHS